MRLENCIRRWLGMSAHRVTTVVETEGRLLAEVKAVAGRLPRCGCCGQKVSRTKGVTHRRGGGERDRSNYGTENGNRKRQKTDRKRDRSNYVRFRSARSRSWRGFFGFFGFSRSRPRGRASRIGVRLRLELDDGGDSGGDRRHDAR